MTEHFTGFDPQNPEIVEVYFVRKRCETNMKVHKLWYVRSGKKV